MNVFLSHASEDKPFAHALASFLSRNGFTVWHDDPNSSLPGDNWARERGKALEASDAMVVILSSGGSKSPWLARDLEYALGSQRFAGRVVGIVVEPTKRIPWILEHLHAIVRTDDAELAGREVLDHLTGREATRR